MSERCHFCGLRPSRELKLPFDGGELVYATGVLHAAQYLGDLAENSGSAQEVGYFLITGFCSEDCVERECLVREGMSE